MYRGAVSEQVLCVLFQLLMSSMVLSLVSQASSIEHTFRYSSLTQEN